MSCIFVTGMGVISAIGDDVAENHESLVAGKCGIGQLDLFPSKYAGLLPFGEVKLTTELLKEKLVAAERGLTRTTLLALHALQEAIDSAGLTEAEISSSQTALIGATTVGGMCMTDELYHDANKDSDGSEYLSSYDCASVNMYLQSRFKNEWHYQHH